MSEHNSTAAGRDPDALAVALYGQWVHAGGGAGTDGRRAPRWAQLPPGEQRRWGAVALLAAGLAADDAAAREAHAERLASQAGAYPWDGGSLPPAAVAPEHA